MIIDTLLHYFPGTRAATKDEILADLTPLGYASAASEYGPAALDTSCAMWVELVIADAVWDNTDPDHPVLVTPRQVYPGLAVWIACDHVDDALWNLTGNVARLQADRDKHAAGDPSWLIRSRISAGDMATVAVQPSYAGTNYPFG